MKRFTVVLAAVWLAACGTPADDAGKGPEENALTDGKEDSFYRPTEHGGLQFGSPNAATITDDEQFHAWTFTLSGDAEIDLRTDISANLDTVMYLYKREPGETNWGRYIDKNDDHDGEIWSRIARAGEAGEYRVIVKPFKTALRGRFSLVAACEGAGCRTEGDGGDCSPDDFESLPTMTPWSADCAFDTAGIFASRETARSNTSVLLSEKCGLNGLQRRSVDLFHEWWDDIVGFDDQFRQDPDEDVELYLETREYQGGTVVTVDAGGDEDGLSLIYDRDERLLGAYQHNQSPTVDFYCADANAPPIEAPDPDCYRDVMLLLPHEDESPRTSDSTTISDASTVHEGLGAAAARHKGNTGMTDADTISYEMISWTSTEDREVVEVTIETMDASITYTVVQAWNRWDVRLEADPNGVTFVCER